MKQEVFLHTGYYKAHVARFQLMGTAILAGGSYVVAHPDLAPSPANWWLWWTVATFIPVVANYLMFDVIEAQYSITLLGERMATIEEDVNHALGHRVLIWQSEAIAPFWSKFRVTPQVINPDWFLSAFGAIIAIATAVLVPCLLYWNLWSIDHFAWSRAGAVVLGVSLTIISVAVTFYVGKSVILGMPGKPRQIFRAILKASTTSEK